MGVELDAVREFERQDFAGTDTAPLKGIFYGGFVDEIIESP